MTDELSTIIIDVKLQLRCLGSVSAITLTSPSLLVADIPGLITGAHQNKGLGHSFLRHIERCRCLLYVLDVSQMDPEQQFTSLQQELELYKEGLSHRPAAIVASKIDIVENSKTIEKMVEQLVLPVIPVSALHGHGIETLKRKIRLLFENSLEKFSQCQ